MKKTLQQFLFLSLLIGSIPLLACIPLISYVMPGKHSVPVVRAAETKTQQTDGTNASAAPEFEIKKGWLVKYNGSGGDVVIPDGVKVIGGTVFERNKTIRSVVFPEGVEEIRGYVFRGCTNLESVQFPSTLKKIGDYAFSSCKKLTSVEIPEQVESIGNGAFYNCIRLADIRLPASVAKPGGRYTYLLTPWMEAQMKEQPEDAPFLILNDVLVYAEEKQEMAVAVPEGVTRIADKAFFNSLYTQIRLPESIVEIGKSAFSTCKNLKELQLPDNLMLLDSSALADCTGLTEVVVPDGIKILKFHVFSGNSALCSVILPDSLEEIEEVAFSGCEALESIELPVTLQKIGDGAFANCTNLKKLTLPDKVVSIGSRAFADCTSLSEIVLPSGIQDPGDASTYQNTPWLKQKLAALPDETPYLIINGTLVVGKDGVKTAITLPDSVTRIANYAFEYTDFTKITIPDSVTEIGKCAFVLSGLEELYMADSVKTLGGDAFEKCYQLKKVRLSRSIQSLSGPFYDCWRLKEVELPTELESIWCGFAGCPRLKKIIIHEKLKTPEGLFCSGYLEKAVLYVDKGSATEKYAKKNKLPYQYNTASAYKTYTVKKGDSLWKIAQKYLGDGSRYPEIVKLNKLGKKGITAGQKIKLPKKE